MAFDKGQFKKLIEVVLKKIGMHSDAAVNLLLGTAAQESGFGTYLFQLGDGPAKGVFQMEPNTERDIWKNYIRYKLDTERKMVEVARVANPNALHLQGNLIYQIIMARLHYYRMAEPLPKHDDIEGMAGYWKQYYNTPLGKGRIQEFIENYHKYVA